MKFIKSCCLLFVVLLTAACNKDTTTPYDNPFFYINVSNNSTVRVASDRNETVEYKVYFSGQRQFETMTLDYEFVVGAGLKEGVDFEFVSPKRQLEFLPGIVEMPIAIRWISHPIDATKDNTLAIKLVRNSKNYTIGLPGPDGLQSKLTIVKF
ncbi:MAG: hypothetical protein EOO92_13400 [Pedobacter sp.]|nr:MAG: hypothetical protein EOO92_13400 [Pedobacter sp.]